MTSRACDVIIGTDELVIRDGVADGSRDSLYVDNFNIIYYGVQISPMRTSSFPHEMNPRQYGHVGHVGQKWLSEST